MTSCVAEQVACRLDLARSCLSKLLSLRHRAVAQQVAPASERISACRFCSSASPGVAGPSCRAPRKKLRRLHNFRRGRLALARTRSTAYSATLPRARSFGLNLWEPRWAGDFSQLRAPNVDCAVARDGARRLLKRIVARSHKEKSFGRAPKIAICAPSCPQPPPDRTSNLAQIGRSRDARRNSKARVDDVGALDLQRHSWVSDFLPAAWPQQLGHARNHDDFSSSSATYEAEVCDRLRQGIMMSTALQL